MLARLYGVTLEGIEGVVCEVEVDTASGSLERPVIVGLPDTAVKESIERVRSAILNSGFEFPDTQPLINLAPADLKKEGAGFDLAIGLGILRAENVFEDIGGAVQVSSSGSKGKQRGFLPTQPAGGLDLDDESGFEGLNLKDTVIVGELALDGRVRRVNGVLSMAMAAAAKGFSRLIVPMENANEAAVVQGIEVYGVGSLSQAVGLIAGQLPAEPCQVDLGQIFDMESKYEIDFSDVKGQESVKRALIIAAAGGHNVMMIGPPGAGKTMLSQRLATILPSLTLEESLETTRVYSSVGLVKSEHPLVVKRPVRSPHHTASGPSLVGGGTMPRPGELSLSHHGILFLDEFAEFPRNILEMIRQPLEDGTVTISRARGTLTFPAQFMLVAAMNPCPCGYFGSDMKRCRCTPNQIERYMSKISGPLMDRIDIHVDVPSVTFEKLRSREQGQESREIRGQVEKVRDIQTRRFGRAKVQTNATMSHRQVQQHCGLDIAGQGLLKQAMAEFALSARAHDKICKVARTIADLEGREKIAPEHIAEAISYRKLDRKF